VKKRVQFIVNPVSGTKQALKNRLPRLLSENLDIEQFDYDIRWTESRGHATELAREAVQDHVDMVVAVGGDGSISEVANALVGTDVPLGVLPFGSGNGLARHLGYPMNKSKAIQVFNQFKVEEMDLFRLSNSYICSMAGLGFDAYVAEVFANTRRRGLLGYVVGFLKAFIRYPYFDYKVTLSDRTVSGKAFMIVMCNASQHGYNVKIAPKASVKDGMMDVWILDKFPRWKATFIFFSILRGMHHKSRYFNTFSTNQVVIETTKPIHFHTDGEPAAKVMRVAAEVEPRALRVVVP
jgi:YegS/Rv2252/BmrU family lipid kinase